MFLYNDVYIDPNNKVEYPKFRLLCDTHQVPAFNGYYIYDARWISSLIPLLISCIDTKHLHIYHSNIASHVIIFFHKAIEHQYNGRFMPTQFLCI